MMVPRLIIYENKEKFIPFFFCTIMSSSTLSNLSQADTKMLEQQYQEMRCQYKKEQKLQAYLEEVAKACYLEQVVQKVRKVTEAKA